MKIRSLGVVRYRCTSYLVVSGRPSQKHIDVDVTPNLLENWTSCSGREIGLDMH